MKTAFLFPGQGAQVVGMGSDIAQAFPAAAQIYRKADKILGYQLSRLCFDGPQEKLDTTTFSQPAIFVTSAAILEVIRAEAPSIKPDVTAGLSLGEYTALYAAGLCSFEQTLLLVSERGRAMQAAADATDGAMVSIIGLDEEKVNQLCEQAAEGELLKPVNFNCPGQIVISGAKAACERAARLAPEFGAIKAVPLAVAGAFHTEMMTPAAEKLSAALEQCSIEEPADTKVIANIDAEYYSSAQKIRHGLVKQLTCPILWQKCMQRLMADGVQRFYEIGPGKVLTGLMRRIDRKTPVTNISNLAALRQLLGR